MAAAPFSRARYRLRQFTRGLRPHLSADEVAEVRGRLSEREFALFLNAQPRDRRHSMDLYRLLQQQGASDAALVAALVHDVGKGQVATWHRVAFVPAPRPAWSRSSRRTPMLTQRTPRSRRSSARTTPSSAGSSGRAAAVPRRPHRVRSEDHRAGENRCV